MTASSTTDMPEKMPLTSMDIAEQKREELKCCLKAAFPEVFGEDKIDFDQLKRVLGEWVEPDRERFGLNWPGKAACMKVIQAPSVGTLKPCPEESVDWDTTQNLFIEGDNLEVLKLLQKAYFGKVKMIYIDPPYNTGKEFIYPDKYSETLETYLEYTGQKDSEGRKFSTNTDTSGRFHSRWLNMMYPRLYLAKNLLRDDGAIFISIDDNEQANLKALCDQVFGEENFIASNIWQKVFSPKNTAQYFSEDHDYVMVYAKNAEVWRPTLLPRTEEANARYANPDNDSRGPWTSSDLTARNYYGEGLYEVTAPGGAKYGPGRGRYWRQSYKSFLDLDKDNRIWWGESKNNMPRLKRFLSEVKQGIVPQTFWSYQLVGHTQEAKKELLKYVSFEDTENVLNSVKPVKLLQHILKIGTNPNEQDIVLDFFAGSGPMGHAVLKQNAEDSGNRKFILVQLPEPLPNEEDNLKTIADMTKCRITNYGKELDTQIDKGFRVYKLDRSCFKQWEGDIASLSEEQLVLKLKDHANHIDDKASAEDILYEILLKDGFELTVPIERLTLAGKEVFSIAENQLLICLEPELTQEVMDAMAALDPSRVIVLDSGFQNNDQLKANAVQTFKARARDKETAIVFRTV